MILFDAGKGSIIKFNENAYQVYFRLNGKTVNIGTYSSKELAEEVREYFVSINYDLDKFKESKYWKKLKNVGPNSEKKKGQGSIYKLDENAYRVSFSLRSKITSIGIYPSKELAEEVREYFISINHDLDKFKESKYWKELRNVGATSEEKKGQGTIKKISENAYQVLFNLRNKTTSIGVYSSKELAEEARNYFVLINYDLDKFKESKYWTERTDRRQSSKNYWNHITMNKRNTSGVTGVYLDRARFLKGYACWVSQIVINNKHISAKFYSKEASIKYRLELEQLGHEFNENHDQKRFEEQMKYIEERARNMEEEKIAEKAAEAYKKGIENPDGEDTSTWDSKERKKKMKKLNVGDSVNFKDGRKGIVEDYDEKYYYVKDNNANIVKITKIQDEESISWDEYYSELYEEWFGDIYDIFSRVNVITKLECYEEEGNPFNSAFIFVFNYNQNKNEQKVILRFELDTKKHSLKMQPEYILQTEEEKIHRKGKVTIINNVNDILDEMRPKILAYIKEFLLGIRFAFKQLNEEYEQSQNTNNIIM